jgi:hypothetical protein
LPEPIQIRQVLRAPGKHSSSSSKSRFAIPVLLPPLVAKLFDDPDPLVGSHLPPKLTVGALLLGKRR